MQTIPDLIIFPAAFVYFLTMMFDRHTRTSTALSGLLLIGSAGTILLETDHRDLFRSITATAIAAILLRRVYIEWKHS